MCGRRSGREEAPSAAHLPPVAKKLPARRICRRLHRRHLGGEKPAGSDDSARGKSLEDRRIPLLLAERIRRVGIHDGKAGAGVGGNPAINIGNDAIGGRDTQGGKVLLQDCHVATVLLNECRGLSAARERLYAHRARAREEIEKVIDILALHKINTFHWHLTDDQGWRIESKKYPDLVKAGPYYTQEDLRAVVEYARRRYVTVVPEVELPGHALAALSAYPVFSYHPDSTIAIATDLGIYDEIFCPSDTTYTFFTDIFGELFDIFPSKYYHIGGDECPPDDGSQAAFIVRITEFLQAHGKEVIAWDEVVDRGATPGTIALSFTPNRWCYLDYYQEEGDGYPSQPYFLPLPVFSA